MQERVKVGDDLGDREKAKELYGQGVPMTKIADQLSLNYNTVRQWKSRQGWDGKTVTSKRNAKIVEGLVSATVRAPDGMSEKEEFFCRLYVNTHNGTQSAIKAGYSARSAHVLASRLLKHDKIKAYIGRLKEYKLAALMLSVEDVVEKQMRIAFSDITDFVDFGVKEQPLYSNGAVITTKDPKTGEDKPWMHEVNTVVIKDCTAVDGGIIAEISQGPSGVKIKLEDRQKAMDWLTKYFMLNPMDKHKKAYEDKRLALEQDRLDHQKKIDERDNF